MTGIELLNTILEKKKKTKIFLFVNADVLNIWKMSEIISISQTFGLW